MSATKNNPLAVYCSYCGAPAEYDIVHQEYHCGYCGGTTDIHEPVQRLGEWRDARKKEVLRDKSVAEEIWELIGLAKLQKVLESSYNSFENSGKR